MISPPSGRAESFPPEAPRRLARRSVRARRSGPDTGLAFRARSAFATQSTNTPVFMRSRRVLKTVFRRSCLAHRREPANQTISLLACAESHYSIPTPFDCVFGNPLPFKDA